MAPGSAIALQAVRSSAVHSRGRPPDFNHWLLVCMERLLTSVDVSHTFTPPAADVAAPDELTLTPLHVPDHMGVVAPATAEEVAAIGTS